MAERSYMDVLVRVPTEQNRAKGRRLTAKPVRSAFPPGTMMKLRHLFSSTTEKITGTLKVVAKHQTTSHSNDEERDVSEPLDLDPEDLLGTIEQVEETLTIMTTVVSQLKEQLMEQLGVVDTRDMSVEEFLEFCENSDGVLH